MGSSRSKRNNSRRRISSSSSETNTLTPATAIDAVLVTLQPLRDLSRNWDVDIASCLEEYLQELTGIHPQQIQKITESSTKTPTGEENDSDVPNFAHAALILQNSSNVYSRKVEYLYSLVYKALEEFFQASKTSSSSTGKNGRRNKGVDADVEEFFDYDPNECFLLLDDVVPQDLTMLRKKINLKEEEDDGDPGLANNRSQITNNNVTRLSLGGLSVTRTERNNMSSNGVISSQQQQRALLGILNNGSLRLMSGHCDVRDDGLMLMPGSQSSNSKQINTSNFEKKSLDTGALLDRKNINSGTPTDNNLDTGPRNLFHDAEDHDEGPGFIMNDEIDYYGNEMDVNKSPVNAVALASSQTLVTKRVAFADSVYEQFRNEQHNEQKKQKKDPWALLDPHAIGDPNYKLKPLRIGKTIRLPEGITQLPSECVTGSSTSFFAQPEHQSLAPPILRPSLAIETFRVAVGKQLGPSNAISFRGLAYGDEFLYIAKENAKLKAAKRREERKYELESRDLKLGGQSKLQVGDKFDDNHSDDNDFGGDDGSGGFDFGGSEDIDYNDDDHGEAVGNSGLDILGDAFGKDYPPSGEENWGEWSGSSRTFEEICQSHIQAFAKCAEKFALTTKLTDRISQWQAYLTPILEEEERKVSFDIHRYSQIFMESAIKTRQENESKSIDEFNGVVEFNNVTEGCTKSDVCRFFLASLCLANSGNVMIEEAEGFSEYRFQILSAKVDKPMETYRAPSTAAAANS